MDNTSKLTILIDAKNNADKAFKDVNSSLGTISQKAQALKPAFIGMAAVGTAAFAGLAVGIKGALDASAEAAKAQAQLGAVLKSTGGAAGITAEKAIALSKSLQTVSTFGDDAILSAENMLLTFTNIKDDIFPDTTKIVLDMSVALGQDLKSSAIQVGKALNDPILGVSALSRVGVNFTEDQKDVIETLVKTGDVLGAQKLILEELGTEFGGSAAAQTETFAGKMKMLKEKTEDLKEAIGNALIPIIENLLEKIKPVVDKVVEWTEKNPEMTKNILIAAIAVALLTAAIGFLGLALPAIISGFGLIKVAAAASWGFLFSPGGVILVGIALAIAGMYLLYKNWDAISKKLGDICNWIGGVFKSVFDFIVNDVIGNFVKVLQMTLEGIAGFLKNPIEGAKGAISALSTIRESIESSSGGQENRPYGFQRVSGYSSGTQQTVNFNFNGDINDKDSLISSVLDAIDRTAGLKEMAGQ